MNLFMKHRISGPENRRLFSKTSKIQPSQPQQAQTVSLIYEGYKDFKISEFSGGVSIDTVLG